MAPGGGRTDWDSHSIADIIAKLHTMDSEQAVADAAALNAAVTSAQAVVTRLGSVFTSTEWILQGNAATAGYTSAHAIADDIATSAHSASSAISALSEASKTLTVTRTTEFTLAALQAQAVAEPQNAAAIKASVTTTMNSHYSDPMSGTTVPATRGAGVARRAGTTERTATDTPTPNTPGKFTPTDNTPSNTPVNSVAPATKTPTANSDPSTSTTTTTVGNQQDSTQKQSNAPTSANDGKQRNIRTSTPVRIDPVGQKRDKPLNLTGGGSRSPSRSPGSRAAAPAQMTPLRRVGISSISPGATPMRSPGSQSPTNRGTAQPYAPHAGRSRGGEDGKHKVASFLNTARNGEEVVGSLPLVGPPVIGDWAGPPLEEAERSDRDRSAEK
ncbi:hypothetical protein [Gordonia sp. CPCC 205333]|uniref:hypothetical protein n=1 Tax=Gordonia sp. CPCC 205333 TaxID=3140790 RepID=UPI003AF37EA2